MKGKIEWQEEETEIIENKEILIIVNEIPAFQRRRILEAMNA